MGRVLSLGAGSLSRAPGSHLCRGGRLVAGEGQQREACLGNSCGARTAGTSGHLTTVLSVLRAVSNRRLNIPPCTRTDSPAVNALLTFLRSSLHFFFQRPMERHLLLLLQAFSNLVDSDLRQTNLSDPAWRLRCYRATPYHIRLGACHTARR